MNTPQPQRGQRVRVAGQGDLLAVVPRLLGFNPEHSFVVTGLHGDRGRLQFAMRYDLDQDRDEIAAHATGMLVRHDCPRTVAIGYGPGAEVTPVMDRFRNAAADAGVGVHDALRVDEGRYYSYLCTEPDCHPVEGTPLGPEQVAESELDALGSAPGRREDLGAKIARPTGERAREMERAYTRAVRQHDDTGREQGPGAAIAADLEAVQSAISDYRAGGAADDEHLARVGVAVRDIRVRDDAWARMVPEHAEDHARLWADTTRTAPAPFGAAPAALLAFTSAQQGKGAEANVAVDRALEDDPDYSMAHLIGKTVAAGVPPSELRMPMTPEDVAAAYGLPAPAPDPARTPEPDADSAPAPLHAVPEPTLDMEAGE